jgi:hypothetical protein
MLENPKEMNTTTQPETAIVMVKKVHLFACFFFIVYGIFNCIPKTKGERVKWIISSQALMRERFVEYVNRANPYQSFGCSLARIGSQGLLMCVHLAIRSVHMNGILNARKSRSRQMKETVSTNDQRNGATIIPKVEKLFHSVTTINRGIETGSLFMPTTVDSANVAEKKNNAFSPSITLMTTGILKGKRGFIPMVHNFTAGLLKTTFLMITGFFVITVILGERETAVSVPTRKVQRLSLRRVQPSGWKRPLPLGVMI